LGISGGILTVKLKNATGMKWTESRHTVKHLKIQRQPLIMKDYLTQIVCNFEVEETRSRMWQEREILEGDTKRKHEMVTTC
jgi:hypothetical protein